MGTMKTKISNTYYQSAWILRYILPDGGYGNATLCLRHIERLLPQIRDSMRYEYNRGIPMRLHIHYSVKSSLILTEDIYP